jgi:hypothetical protein
MLRTFSLAVCTMGIVIAAALTSCDDPRVPPIPRSEALGDRTVREVKVIKVWDQTGNRMNNSGDPHVSHFVEVDIVSGDEKGTRMTLPFDEWNVGEAPPSKGTILMIAPADWVKRNPKSQGRPFGGG